MGLKTKEVMDSNLVANGIMQDIIDIDRIESMFSKELSSEDLFRIDCAILASLKKTEDFSRDLLQQLEKGKFETFVEAPQKTIENELKIVQQEAIADITLPLQSMFDEMADYVVDYIRS